MTEVVTNGSGEVARIADRAELRLAYEARGRDRTAAVTELTARVGRVEQRLARDGVEVRARHLSVHDVWDGRRRSGAQAHQSYVVRITDLGVLDDLMSDLVTTEPASLQGPAWELTDPTDAARQAQRHAVDDARGRAEGYAAALGLRLGALVRLADGGAGHVTPQVLRSASFGAAERGGRPDIAELSLTPDEVTVTATCATTWTLMDPAD